MDPTLAALNELIDALDRRVPHVERVGEIRIAHEAEALRKAAVARIEEIRKSGLNRRRGVDLANAVMSDDGGPAYHDEEASAALQQRSR